MKSLYTSTLGKQEIIRLYEEKLSSLGVTSESRRMNTAFGETHVLIAGDKTKTPLVALHGSNGCAPVAIETYKDLLDTHCIYAIDVLAQPNKSAETRLSMKDDSYGKWLNEVLAKLQLSNVKLAGFSFGGLIILKALEYNESNIKSAYLSAPAYIVNGNPIKALFRFFIPMKRYMKSKQPRDLHQFLDAAFTMKDEFAYNYLSAVFQYFTMDFAPVPKIKTQRAKKITTPIYLFAAENDIIFPGRKMLKRAKSIFPSLRHAELLMRSKHVQNTEHNSKIAKFIESHSEE